MATSDELSTLRRQKKEIGEEIRNIRHDILQGYSRIKQLQAEKKEMFERIKALKAEVSG